MGSRSKAGKLYLPAVQRWGADQRPENSTFRRSNDGEQIKRPENSTFRRSNDGEQIRLHLKSNAPRSHERGPVQTPEAGPGALKN
jgi:hypothetical protein